MAFKWDIPNRLTVRTILSLKQMQLIDKMRTKKVSKKKTILSLKQMQLIDKMRTKKVSKKKNYSFLEANAINW